MADTPGRKTFNVPAEAVGAILGPRGSLIRETEQISNAKVSIDKMTNRETNERAITLTGDEAAIAKAYELINLRVATSGEQQLPFNAPAPTRGPAPMGGGGGGGGGARVLIEITGFIEVENVRLGAIVGLGGSIIKGIEKESGAKLSIAKQASPEATSRIVNITGTMAAASLAAHIVIARVLEDRNKKPDDSPDDVKVNLTIPNTAVGSVIGRGGEIVRHIERSSRATISVDKKMADTNTRSLSAIGTYGAVAIASQLIASQLAEEERTGGQPPAPYGGYSGGRNRSRSRSPPPRARFNRAPRVRSRSPPGGATRQFGGYGGPVPAPRYPARGGEDGFSVSQVIPNRYVGAVLGRGGEIVKQIQAASGATVGISKMTTAHDERPLTITGQPSQCAAAALDIANRLRNDPTGTGAPPTDPHAHQATLTVSVPGANFGAIMGRGGDIMRQLEQESGSRISVAKNFGPRNPAAAREVTVTGTGAAVDHAISLIAQRIENDHGPGM